MATDARDNVFEIVANYTYDWETWFLPSGTVQWINPAVERMTGYSIDECIAMPDYPASLIHDDDRQRIVDLLAEARTGTSGNDIEFRLLRKDGEIGWAAVSWQPVSDRTGRSLGFRTSMRDISERKKAEEILRLTMAETEKANASKTRFLAAVSHDLRQPLQAISMYIGALQARSRGAVPDDILADVKYCLENCNELLDDLLDVSRLNAGAVAPNFSSVAVSDVLESIDAGMQAMAEARGNDLHVINSSVFVDTDAVMLHRILQNLVSNAIRYTQNGQILVGCRRRNGRLFIEVWDTGIGIEPDQREEIFEEFYQIGNVERDRRKGIGLGLAIVKRFVSLLDADLTVRSWPGRGSCFAVGLPITDEILRRPVVARRASRRSLRGRTLVIIDDEPLQLKSMKHLLEMLGADVIAASGPAQAVSLLGNGAPRPDAVIVDYRLADSLTGLDAINILHREVSAGLPAMIVTGDTDPDRIADARSGGHIVLHKPVDAGDLVEAVSTMLRTPGPDGARPAEIVSQ